MKVCVQTGRGQAGLDFSWDVRDIPRKDTCRFNKAIKQAKDSSFVHYQNNNKCLHLTIITEQQLLMLSFFRRRLCGQAPLNPVEEPHIQ